MILSYLKKAKPAQSYRLWRAFVLFTLDPVKARLNIPARLTDFIQAAPAWVTFLMAVALLPCLFNRRADSDTERPSTHCLIAASAFGIGN